MFKKVIALSTAAMILLTPMSASAVTWGQIASGLQTSNTFKEDKLTVTKDGDTYTFTGGEIESNMDEGFSDSFQKGGSFFFNGVQIEYVDISAGNEKYYVVLDKNTKVGEVWVYAYEKGEANLVNEGTIGRGEGSDIVISENGHLTNKGTLKTGEGIYFPTIDYDYRKDENQVISNVSAYADDYVKNGTQEEAEKLVDRMFSFETPGTYTVIATLTWKDENGEYHHKDFIVTRTVGEDEGPSEEEIRHDMEMKRQAEAIGGVYGSPYWIKQLYLGYHSYNLRLLIDGQPVTMRERLNWNADKSKGISLRVNTVAPEKLTMRFDEKVLEVFERTNITTVTLLDKNGAAVMQYNVSDLRAAYDQYGLNDADQLVVGGVDDDVMKIGADGQLVPVE
ncbi:MAG: hypothetical protein ACLS6G_13485 [Christensenellales bacterium]